MIELYLSALVTFFVVIDPPGCAPIYAGLTSGASPAHRRAMAIRAVFVASILFVFAAVGEAILHALDVSLVRRRYRALLDLVPGLLAQRLNINQEVGHDHALPVLRRVDSDELADRNRSEQQREVGDRRMEEHERPRFLATQHPAMQAMSLQEEAGAEH